MRVLRLLDTGYARLLPAAMTFELLKCTELDDPMVGPGYFEAVGQLVDGTCAGGTPDHEAYGGGAEITDNQGKILHSVRLLLGPVYC